MEDYKNLSCENLSAELDKAILEYGDFCWNAACEALSPGEHLPTVDKPATDKINAIKAEMCRRVHAAPQVVDLSRMQKETLVDCAWDFGSSLCLRELILNNDSREIVDQIIEACDKFDEVDHGENYLEDVDRLSDELIDVMLAHGDLTQNEKTPVTIPEQLPPAQGWTFTELFILTLTIFVAVAMAIEIFR